MEINKDLLCHVGPEIGLSKNDIVICCQEVFLLKKNDSKEKVLLATEYSLYLFKCSKSGKSYSIMTQFNWTDLKEIEFIQKDQFSMTYQEGMIKIQHHGATYLLKLILNHITSILNPQEIPKLNVPSNIIDELYHLPDSFVRRFRYKLKTNNQKLPDDLISSLKKATLSNELDINKLPSNAVNYIDLILSCLQVEPAIVSIVLPHSNQKQTFWNQLAVCMKFNTTLRTLVTSDKLESSVKSLCESIVNNKESKLKNFAFIETEITEKQLSTLSKLLNASSAESLFFDKSMSPETMNKFITSSNFTNIFHKLKSFTLKNIVGVNVKNVFETLNRVTKLSFINCNINVNDVIQEIQKVNCVSLSVIGGLCSGKFDSNTKLNPTLAHLNMSKIAWNSPATFCAAWKVFMNHTNENFKLVLQKETIPGDWSQVLKEIGASGSNKIDSFSWEMNPVDSSIIPFFTKSTNIKNLSFQGSLNSTNATEFAKIFVKMKDLKYLNVDGTSEVKMGESTVSFLQELCESKSLEDLSIKNQDFGDAGLNELANFLMKNLKVTKIAFEGNKITKAETFIHFFETVMNRGPPLSFRFPEEELHAMKKNHLVKTSKINHMKECYDIILSGNESIVVSEENDSDKDLQMNDNDNETESDDNTQLKDTKGTFQVSTGSGGSGVFKNVEWQIDLPKIPDVNNDQILKGIKKSYTLSAAHKRLKDSS